MELKLGLSTIYETSDHGYIWEIILSRYKYGAEYPPIAYLPPRSQMTPVSAAPSTATAAQQSKDLFKHPLDPLTPDEACISFTSRHQGTYHRFDLDRGRFIRNTPLCSRTYECESDQVFNLVSLTASKESCSCILGHPIES